MCVCACVCVAGGGGNRGGGATERMHSCVHASCSGQLSLSFWLLHLLHLLLHACSWIEAEKRQGRMPDAAAYAASCAARAASAGGLSEAAERQRRFLRVAAACQAEQLRLCLVSLSDLPLLARALLRRSSDALRWARSRWSHVLVSAVPSWASCQTSLRLSPVLVLVRNQAVDGGRCP